LFGYADWDLKGSSTMAVSNAVKIGQIDLGQIAGSSSGSGTKIGFAIGRIEDKNAYVQQIARIAVGDLDPKVELSHIEQA
jgi:hypothetical protein